MREAASLPYTFVSRAISVAFGLLGFVMMLGLVAICLILGLYGSAAPDRWWLLGLPFFGALALASAAQIVSTLTWRVTLTPGEIRTNSIFGEKRLARRDIEGYRPSGSRGDLELKAGKDSMVLDHKALKLPQVRDWLGGLANLDPLAHIEAEAAIHQWKALEREEAQGAAPKGRLELLLRLRPVRLALAGYGLLSLGVVIVPSQWWAVLADAEALALLAPFLTLFLRDYASVLPPQGSPLISLWPIWASAPMWIFLRGPMYFFLGGPTNQEWGPLFDLAPIAIPAALVFWGLTLWSTPNARSGFNAVGASLLAIVWGAGVAWLVQYTPMLDAVGL